MPDIFEHFSDPLNVRKFYHKVVLAWGIAGILDSLVIIAGGTGASSTYGLIQLAVFAVVVLWMYAEVKADTTGKPFVNVYNVFLKYLLIAVSVFAFIQDFRGLHTHTGGAAIIYLLFWIADAFIVGW